MCECVRVCVSVSVSCFSRIRFFVTPWTVAHQAPLSMGFSRQEYWSGVPCPLPGDFRDPGVESRSPKSLTWQAGSLPVEPLGKPYKPVGSALIQCGSYQN